MAQAIIVRRGGGGSGKTSIINATVMLPDTSLTYNGSVQTQTITSVVMNGVTLTENEDFTVSGNTATNAGAHSITLTGINNFEGTKTVPWTIEKAAGSVSLNPATLTLGASGLTGTIAVTRSGDGAINVSGYNSAVISASVSGTTVTVNCLSDVAASTAITVNVAAGTNYLATSATCAVDIVYGVIGATATPVDNWQTWAQCTNYGQDGTPCAGFDYNDYADLPAMLSDADARTELMNSANAVDYMIRSTEVIMPAVVASAAAMTALGLSSYATNAMIASEAWKTAVLASENAITGLDATGPITIPTMTSNTAPSGVASHDSDFTTSEIYPAFRAFDADQTDILGSLSRNTGTAGWCQYEFEIPVWIYRVSYKPTSGTSTPTSRTSHIEVSADGETWQSISSDETQNAKSGSYATIDVVSNNPVPSKISFVRYVATCNTGAIGLQMMQAWGK